MITDYQVAAQVNPVSGGYTLTLPWPNTLKRQDGTPSQQGDVLSVPGDGSKQARPKGTAGRWEVCQMIGLTFLFTPETGISYWVIPVGI